MLVMFTMLGRAHSGTTRTAQEQNTHRGARGHRTGLVDQQPRMLGIKQMYLALSGPGLQWYPVSGTMAWQRTLQSKDKWMACHCVTGLAVSRLYLPVSGLMDVLAMFLAVDAGQCSLAVVYFGVGG